MKSVGKKSQYNISYHASAELLLLGCKFNDEMHRLPTGENSFIPKGVKFFRTHEESNADWIECVARGIAETKRGPA